jgi:DNA repair protein RadC
MEGQGKMRLWANDEKPREKMMEKGADALTNAELLAILINTGTRDRSALDIAKDLMHVASQNLTELSRLKLYEIRKIKGIGNQKAITLLASLELGKRRQMATALERPHISNSRDSFNLLQVLLADKTTEEFYALFLNAANKLLAIESISNGGITSTVVDCRVLFKKALAVEGTTQLIVAHNHPSGNLSPSEQDKRLTEKILEGGKLLDIRLLDHIIVAANQYFSFSDNGLI